MSYTCDECGRPIDQEEPPRIETSNNNSDGQQLDVPWGGNGSLEIKFWENGDVQRHYHEGCAIKVAIETLSEVKRP